MPCIRQPSNQLGWRRRPFAGAWIETIFAFLACFEALSSPLRGGVD